VRGPAAGGAPDVIVAGGGFAGLSAATALVEAGARVTLLEARPYLGGRARSWIDPDTGSSVDNGQHLFMACYRETLRFLDRIGARDRLMLQPRLQLPFVERGGRAGVFRMPGGPAAWAALVGLLGFPGLGWRDRFALLRMGREVRRRSPPAQPPDALDHLTVEQWLDATGQPPETRRRLWHPLAIAALNEEPARASAAMLLPVVREALLGGADGARLGIARVGLSDLYAEPAARYLKGHGCDLRLRTPVRGLLMESGRCCGVRLADGGSLAGGAVISGVPPAELADLLGSQTAGDRFFAPAQRLETVPIVSVYLWFGAPVIDRPFAGLLGGTWEWIFDRRMIGGRAGAQYGVTLVRSAARDLVDRPREALVRSALDDLHAFFPESRRAAPRQTLVIKERRATISPAPGSMALRLPTVTPIDRFLLAGDWTSTGLPATIEGAVLSGHRCAARLRGTPA